LRRRERSMLRFAGAHGAKAHARNDKNHSRDGELW
jgi:hypothetical protein